MSDLESIGISLVLDNGVAEGLRHLQRDLATFDRATALRANALQKLAAAHLEPLQPRKPSAPMLAATSSSAPPVRQGPAPAEPAVAEAPQALAVVQTRTPSRTEHNPPAATRPEQPKPPASAPTATVKAAAVTQTAPYPQTKSTVRPNLAADRTTAATRRPTEPPSLRLPSPAAVQPPIREPHPPRQKPQISIIASGPAPVKPSVATQAERLVNQSATASRRPDTPVSKPTRSVISSPVAPERFVAPPLTGPQPKRLPPIAAASPATTVRRDNAQPAPPPQTVRPSPPRPEPQPERAGRPLPPIIGRATPGPVVPPPPPTPPALVVRGQWPEVPQPSPVSEAGPPAATAEHVVAARDEPLATSSADAGAGAPLSGDLWIDGSLLGRWLGETMARESARPPASARQFNSRMMPRWPGIAS